MNNKVIIYTVAGCPKCFYAKNFLAEQNIEYQEFDVKQDHEKAKEMIQKSRQKTVPVFDINGTIIVGTDKEKILSALK
jgi:glutaredoxin 3